MNAAPTPAPGPDPRLVADGEEQQVTTIASTSSSSAAGPSSASSLIAPKSRPARKQISSQKLEQIRRSADKSANQSGVSFNIWYQKWSGGDREDHTKYKSETRCDTSKDVGYTRGDSTSSSSTYICLYFARGCCPMGSECTFLHRLPRVDGASVNRAHTATTQQGQDIFGRDKQGDYRDDMSGTGSIQQVNRTLYVGKIHEEEDDLRRISQGGGANTPGGPSWRDGGKTVKGGKSVGQVRRECGTGGYKGPTTMSSTEKVLRRHFGEWGPIERVRVLHHRGCAFVTYLSEASAQFAKEAMMNQSLDHDEILNIRWATDDPNPGAIKRERSRMEQEGTQRIAEKMTDEEWQVIEARRRLEAGLPALEEGDHSKRLRIEGQTSREDEEEMARLVEENQRNWEQLEREQREAQAKQQATTTVATSNGFFSSDALGGLAHLQALRKQPETNSVKSATTTVKSAPAKATAPKPTALGGLAAYGSDSEEED